MGPSVVQFTVKNNGKKGIKMWLGIDVGGTFTDAVLVENGKVVSQSKAPTTHDDLLVGILAAIDLAVTRQASLAIERVALSTTVVTNAIIQGTVDEVSLIIMPGPGLNTDGLFPVKPVIVAGYVDHRGRVVQQPNQAEVLEQADKAKIFAVAGKFGVRNPINEQQVCTWLGTNQSRLVMAASQVSGSLNFIRRTNSVYYNAACYFVLAKFAQAIEQALAQRLITAPVYILKADGGTLPLAVAKKFPVESVFTGPAASVLGVMALHQLAAGDAISLDIGGTTTDIALWRQGKPLFADRGASISGYNTAVRAFRLRSVGIGGDSYVRRENGKIVVGPMRLGPAAAVGGKQATLSDAMIAAGVSNFGNRQAAFAAMQDLVLPCQNMTEVAVAVLEVAAKIVQQAIKDTIAEETAQPVYTVNDIIHPEPFIPCQLIGVGGAAAGLVPVIAAKLDVPYVVPAGAAIANAIGAAVARPTMSLTIRADTAEGFYTIPELLLTQPIKNKNFSLADARKILAEQLLMRASQAGIRSTDLEEVYTEEFNMIRGFRTIGKIISCSLQIKPGVLMHFNAGQGGLKA
jgi:N-methylhydantoinase A/oxoprolinase/acetone carboxylase beta subunit